MQQVQAAKGAFCSPNVVWSRDRYQQGTSSWTSTHQATTLFQMLVRLLRNQQLSPRIDRENPVKLLHGDLGDMPERFDARIRHNNIQLPVMADRFLKQGGHFSRLGHVRGDGYSAGAESFDFSNDSLGRARGAGVIDDQGGSAGGELEGVLAAHAPAGAGDESDFAVEAGGGVGGHVGV